jgi:hypothetical protein
MAVNLSFSKQTLDIGSETFEHCFFDRCVLICNSVQAYLRFKSNRVVGCELIGSGWPDTIREGNNERIKQ